MKKLWLILLSILTALCFVACKKDPVKYTVTVTESIDVAGDVTGAGTFEENSEVTLTATTNAGYTFIGWFDGNVSKSTEISYTFTLTADTNLTAKWNINSYTVTLDSDMAGAGTISGAGVYEYNTLATMEASANAGYTFVGWFDGETKKSSDTTYVFTVVGDVDLTAKWSVNSSTVTLNSESVEAGTVSGAGAYTYNQTATLTATANNGYAFLGWYDGDDQVSPNASYEVSVREDMELTAKWQRLYAVSVNANDSSAGSVTGSGVYADGASVTVEATTNGGYTFLGWYDGDNLLTDEETYILIADKDYNLTAKWETDLTEYTVEVTKNLDGAGNVTGVGQYVYGADVTLTATTNAGYTFIGWYDGETEKSSDATYVFTVVGEVNLTAKWEIKTYAVTIVQNIAEAGTTTGAGTFDAGSEATLTASVNEEFVFLGWYDENGTRVTTALTHAFSVNRTIELTAQFAVKTYTVTLTKNSVAAGNVTGADEPFTKGQTATLTATTNTGYTFLGWYEGDVELSTESTYTFTVERDVTIKAKWEKDAIVNPNDPNDGPWTGIV